MTIAVANLLLNLLVVGFLMANISYCWVLNKRIKILQDGKSELASLLKYFDEATNRASESIIALQTASKKIGDNIQTKIDKVNFLIDDLNFMVEKGNKLADKLDANFAVNRALNRTVSEEVVKENRSEAMIEKLMEDEAERSDLPRTPVIEKVSNKEKTSISLEAVLDRVVGRGKAANQNTSTNSRAKPSSSTRSKAEQELLDMIRAGIKG